MTIKEFEIQYALGSMSDTCRVNLAIHKRTAKKILTILSTNEYWYVRCQVAGNLNTPVKILVALSKDVHHASVRIYVRENPNTPKEIIEKLLKDARQKDHENGYYDYN